MKLIEERIFMNTIVRIQVNSSKGTIFTRNKIEEAFDEFDYVVKHFSRFDPNSELAMLNLSSGKPAKVSQELFNLVEFALKLAKTTSGAFDPTIIDILEAYGWDSQNQFKQQNIELFNELKSIISSRPNASAIKLNKKKRTIELRENQNLDLGAIGKGYAIDRACKALEPLGNFLVNAGGDIRAKGLNDRNKFWEIALYLTSLPNKRLTGKHVIGKIKLKDQAIASSGGWERKIGIFHHLINTKTGYPQNEVAQTYVIAPDALTADAWATALFLLGKDYKRIKLPENIKFIIVLSNGELIQTKSFRLSL